MEEARLEVAVMHKRLIDGLYLVGELELGQQTPGVQDAMTKVKKKSHGQVRSGEEGRGWRRCRWGAGKRRGKGVVVF